jgi:hypothetical protein
MKLLLSCVLFVTALFGDFYVVNKEQKVQMTPLKTGVLDFATFATIANINRGNDALHAMGDEIAFNHRHLNFRLVTIALKQTNYTITEFSKKADDASSEYYIDFDNYTRNDGVMLQLFYKNRWYGVFLGEPLEMLQKLFAQEDLEPKEAYKQIQRARIAFKDDRKLQELEAVWKKRADAAFDANAKYKKQERIEFPKK